MIKKYLFFIVALLCGSFVWGQTVQRGVVKEYNEADKKTPLAGVVLTVKLAGSTVSGKDGSFALEFLTLKPEERVIYRSIKKDGYEIFNKQALDQWTLSSTHTFEVVMCRSDKFKKIYDNYMSVSSESYAKQLKKERAALDRLKAEGRLKDEEYRTRLREIQDNYEKQLDNLDNYVDRFSRIDLSEIKPVEQEIIALVREGRMDEAIAKYEAQNYVDKYLDELSDIQEISSAIGQLSELKDAKVQSSDSLLSSVSRYIDMLKLAGGVENNRKILDTYTRIADRDTTNTNWLLKTGLFIEDYFADYNLALSYYQKALRSALGQHGEKHPDVATSYNDIGGIYYNQGAYDHAFEYIQKALNIRLEIFGDKHPDVAEIYHNIGCIYDSQGDYDRALEYYQKALNILLEIFGEKHPDVATTYNSIGGIYDKQGDYYRAFEYIQKALSIRLEMLGEKHPDVATSYNKIGGIYNSQGDYDRALEFYQKALNIRLEIYGDRHPDVAEIYHNVGTIYNNQGAYDRSLENYQKALNILLGIFGEMHPHVATSYNNIGGVYSRLGDYDRALEYYQKALNMRLEIFGEKHTNVMRVNKSVDLIKSKIGGGKE